MRESWDRRPSSFPPPVRLFTTHLTPQDGTAHVTTAGADCWCEPTLRWCEDGCCRIVVHGLVILDE